MLNIRLEILNFLDRSGMSPTQLGVEAVRDGRFVADILARRRSPRIDTVERMLAYIQRVDGKHPDIAAKTSGARLDQSASGLRTLVFTMPTPTPLLNGTLRMHYRQRMRIQKSTAWEILAATAGVPPTEPFQWARVTVERMSVGRPGWQGVAGGANLLLNCLVRCTPGNPQGLGIIHNDEPSSIQLVTKLVHVSKAREQGTRVTIEELPPTTNA